LRQLQLQLEIATLPSYMNLVDLDPFGQLSVFLIECRAQLPAHQGLIAALTAAHTLATRQFLE
jgi:hypothetical protein